MGRIEVDPVALETLGSRIQQHEGEAQQVHAEAVNRGGASTGAPPLDASLSGFARVWSQWLGELGEAGQRLADNTVVAARNYRTTDRSAIPAASEAGEDSGADADAVQLGGGSVHAS